MNYVFFGLAAVAFALAVVRGTPEHPGQVQDGEVTVELASGSPAKVGDSAVLAIGGAEHAGSIEAIADGKATIRTDAPGGAVVVTIGTEQAMRGVSAGAMAGAKGAVDLAIGLVGAMTLFLGLMKVVEAAGGLDLVARAIRPLMVRLFPDIPHDHPAVGAVIMNIAANMLGLANAATPFGIRAMQELQKLNRNPGTATNAMALFLAINTSGVAVLPTGVIALRASLGSRDPASIFVPTLVASGLNTVVAVLAAKTLQRFFRGDDSPALPHPAIGWREWLPLLGSTAALVALVGVVYTIGEAASAFVVPVLIVGMLTFGFVRGVKVYEVFVTGAKDGFETAMRIIPYMVAILSIVAMFRASGGIDIISTVLAPVCNLFGVPPEVMPLAMLRSLSGSGAFAFLGELSKTHGPDSHIGQLAATMQGTSETTFYVLAVYFGSVGVTRVRHALACGIIADVSGVVAAVLAVALFLG
jgi:spore maturation protein SpmA